MEKIQQQKSIIDIKDFQSILSDPNLVILDCTIDKINQKIDNQTVELIPNSLFFDIENVFSDLGSGLPHTMVDAAVFEKEVQKLGINNNSKIVLYDRWGVYSSPRVWWMFQLMGHQDVLVLNGGLPAWKKSNKPLSFHHAQPIETGNFKADFQTNWIIDKQELLAAIGNHNIRIIDARSKARFDGIAAEPRPGIRSGHHPQASNVPFDLLLEDIYLKNQNQLQQTLKDHTSNEKQNIFTCGSGITASILALAAYEVGTESIRVYDGSWAEWGADSQLPIE